MEEKLLIYYMWYPSKESPQTHHENGRYLLKQALKNEYDIEFTEEMLEHKEYGKPVLKHGPVQFSISHCKGMAVCVLSPFALGADTEGPRRVTEALIDRVCCEKESRYVKEYGCRYKAQRFLRLWTLKESYLKMTGEGLRLPLDQVQFEITRELEQGNRQFQAGEFLADRIKERLYFIYLYGKNGRIIFDVEKRTYSERNLALVICLCYTVRGCGLSVFPIRLHKSIRVFETFHT